ncbi:hypothetical protein ACHAWF_004897 [Thalassiosira exigua]
MAHEHWKPLSLTHVTYVSLWLLVGSVASTGVCTLLKAVVRQPRPPRYDDGAHAGGWSSTGCEHGMPSNHAVSAWFVAAFVAAVAFAFVRDVEGPRGAVASPPRGCRGGSVRVGRCRLLVFAGVPGISHAGAGIGGAALGAALGAA